MRVICSTVGNDSVNHWMVKLSILVLLLRARYHWYWLYSD